MTLVTFTRLRPKRRRRMRTRTRLRFGKRVALVRIPKVPRTPAEVKALAREHTVGAIETLVKVHKNPKSPPAARVAAASEILNRGWGRAPSTDLEGAEQLVIKVVKFAQEQIEENEMKVIEHRDDEGSE